MQKLVINTNTYQNLHSLAKQYSDEKVGVLIGLKAIDYLYIFHARIAGHGGQTTVASEERALNAINALLRRYPDELDAISFHTHPLALGPEWQENLSSGDIANLEREPNRRTVLVSGHGVFEFRKSMWGVSKERVEVKDLPGIEGINLIREWEEKVRRELNALL